MAPDDAIHVKSISHGNPYFAYGESVIRIDLKAINDLRTNRVSAKLKGASWWINDLENEICNGMGIPRLFFEKDYAKYGKRNVEFASTLLVGNVRDAQRAVDDAFRRQLFRQAFDIKDFHNLPSIKFKKFDSFRLLRDGGYDFSEEIGQFKKIYEAGIISKEEYVLWVEDASKVQDHGICEYLKWAAEFIKQQREEDSARFPTLAGKLDTPSWPQLPNKTNAQFLFKNDMNDNYAIYHNRVQNAQVDKRLFLGNSKVDVDERLIFAVLNSVFTYLGMELMGRTNLGEGALDVNVTDYKLIPIVDPELLKKKLEEEHRLTSFLATVDKVMAKKPMNITSEAKNEDRLKMEQTVLGVLGFTKKDINRFYQDLIMLANLRTSRASSLRKEKSD